MRDLKNLYDPEPGEQGGAASRLRISSRPLRGSRRRQAGQSTLDADVLETLLTETRRITRRFLSL